VAEIIKRGREMSVEIIAEAAQGYEGDPTQAKQLAKAAVKAGADGVKFQIVYADELAAPGYQYFELFQQLEMDDSAWEAVADIVRDAGCKLYFDVFGDKGVALAQKLSADGVKIHATDFFNTELINTAVKSFSKVFLSLGGIYIEELDEFMTSYDLAPNQCTLMHGFQAEPTPVEANNIRRIESLQERYPNCSVGFMDHSDGDLDDAQTLALLSLPYAVPCIEKHITLDRALEIEDFPSGLAPSDFKQFVTRVRRLEAALGSPDLGLTEVEEGYRSRMLKVAVVLRDLEAGHVLAREDVHLLRAAEPPANPIRRIEEVVGKRLGVALSAHAPVEEGMVE